MFKRLSISADQQSPSVDIQLWDALREGQAEALDELFDRYVLLLMNYGSKMTQDQALIEDCIQELFVELWSKKDRLSPTTSVKFYLLKSINRRIRRKLKQREKTRPLLEGEEKLSFQLSFSYEQNLIAKDLSEEKKQRLQEALQKLSPRQKEIIFHKFYNKLSYEEICDLMSINTNSAYKLLNKAISKLRKILTSFLVSFL